MTTPQPDLKPHLQPFSAMTDFEVVERVRNGDTALFELLMRRYNRRLFLAARSILGDDALAEDVVQETYLIAFERLTQFRDPGSFGAWLLRIGTREALRTLRRHSRLHLTDDEPQQPEASFTLPHLPQPEESQLERETTHLLEEALDGLPRNFRIVFVLRELEEMSTAETAASLDITHGTVKSRLHRARSLLQLRLGRPLAALKAGAYPFAGTRCDRIVAAVLARLAG